MGERCDERPGSTLPSARLTLPWSTTSVRDARSFVRAQLRSWQLEDLEDAAVLLASELVTNAIVHAAPVGAPEAHHAPLVLELALGPGGLRLCVSDPSPVLPARRRYSQTASTGRGLALLDQLAGEWGTEVTATGKNVWTVLPRPRDPTGDQPGARDG